MPGVQCLSKSFQCSKETSRQTGKKISVIQCNASCVAEYLWTTQCVLKNQDSAFINPFTV